MEKKSKTVAFHSLGCKVNNYESELMLQSFRKKGYEIVTFEQKADIYVVNTCTVTQIADKKSRQLLRRAKRLNPEALVVAAGCAVETGGIQTASSDIDLVIGNAEKLRIVSLVEECLSGQVLPPRTATLGDRYPTRPPPHWMRKTRWKSQRRTPGLLSKSRTAVISSVPTV